MRRSSAPPRMWTGPRWPPNSATAIRRTSSATSPPPSAYRPPRTPAQRHGPDHAEPVEGCGTTGCGNTENNGVEIRKILAGECGRYGSLGGMDAALTGLAHRRLMGVLERRLG